MSKENRLMGREARRAAKRMAEKYQDDLWKKLQELNNVLRPKPRYIPQWLWQKVVYYVVDSTKINSAIMGPLKSDAIKENGSVKETTEGAKA